MNSPDFILFSSFEFVEGEEPRSCGRAVAFPVAKVGGNRYLFATCSHAITPYVAAGLPIETRYSDGESFSSKTSIVNKVAPAELNCDLSFIEAESTRPLRVAKLCDRRIKPGTSLTHVRNVAHRSDFQDQHVLTTVEAKMRKEKSLFFGEGYMDVTPELKRMVGSLPRHPHRTLYMRSYPGVSGSPLWDSYGNVYGMVASGNETLTEHYPEFYLGFLPAKEIMSCLQLLR